MSTCEVPAGCTQQVTKTRRKPFVLLSTSLVQGEHRSLSAASCPAGQSTEIQKSKC